MSDSIPTSDLLHRYEEVVRANERLQRKVDELDPAIGHTVVLVKLAAAVREWRATGTDEAKQRMFDIAEEYFKNRGQSAGPTPWFLRK